MIYITGTRDIHLENTAVALGKFDGLHRGHQILLKKLNSISPEGYRPSCLPLIFIRHHLFSTSLWS